MTAPKRICVIVNPASGINRDALDTIKQFFDSHRDVFNYALHETHASGDASRFAAQAVADKVDLVAAYGGDGTMMEVAIGLMNSDVPLLMLPGGTANVMAVDLGVPTNLQQALEMCLNPQLETRRVDMGEVDSEYFLLRAGIGYEAEMSARAARGEKSKKGRLAYVENALFLLRNVRSTSYILTIDGETHVRSGITCMICNSSGIGIPNLRFTYNSDVSDGYLDVIVLRNLRPDTLLRTLYHIARSLVPGAKISGSVHVDHWQAQHVTVQMKNRQFVARDGEPLKQSKRVTARIIPGALLIAIQPQSAPPKTESPDESLDRNQAAA
jgi:YegS/Rv2252/BmrU family lipid kinase